MNRNFVSVVIPCFNCQDTILRAVESVWNQKLRPSEVIIVNDCSNDKTQSILSEIYNQYGDEWIKIINLEKNCGPSYARNVGWKEARGDYIAFLDADDSWYPDKIKVQYSLMKKNENIYISGHLMNYPGLKKKNNSSTIEIKRLNFKDFLIKNYFATPSVMVKKEVSERFDVTQKYSEDYLLWLNILWKHEDGLFINHYLGELHKKPYGESGLSGNLFLMEKGEITTYKKIFSQVRGIKKLLFVPILFISLIKFMRRLFRNVLNK